jgi:hypothetical protein
MKKFLIILSLFLSATVLITGCKDDLEDKYLNPEKSTTPSLPGFLTAILNNNRVKPSYWNVRTFLLMQPAVYSQTSFFSNANTAYQQSDGYVSQFWSDFYAPSDNGNGVIGMYRAMEAAYADLSESEKANQEVFVQAAKVILFDQGSQMVDLWGDIPFSEAGALESKSVISNPKFDDQVELYNMFIDGLKSSATFFSTVADNSSFKKADILLAGSADKWRRYANSLRLRLLMRISNVNESTAQTQIMEMLNNPSQYPLIDGGNSGSYSPESSDVLLQRFTNYNDNLRDALTELPSHFAPDYMLNSVMLPANDPRMPVMFDKYGKTVNDVFVPNATFKAMPVTFTSSQQSEQANNYSILDSATFLQNPALPGIYMTASEVNFLKAEAFERWGSSTDAKSAYETAVSQSVSFYYYLNNLNSTGLKKLSKPSDVEVTTFVTASPIAYAGSKDDKLALTWTQKWVHFGFLQSVQAWSEYRRTDYPQLTFPAAALSGFQTPPVRLIYPSIETSYNASNYQAVQAKDTRTTRIFWDVK